MSRKILFSNEFYYHIYNRGVDKRQIFIDKFDYTRFLESLREFNQVEPVGSLYHLKKRQLRDAIPPAGGIASLQRQVDIMAYCLNSNHYHLLIKQNKKRGISEFMRKLSIGYTCYFNEKYKRSGSLFQGTFKAREVKSAHDLEKISVYINCNAEIHGIAKSENWIWSSYLDYIGRRKGTLADKKDVLESFTSHLEYKNFSKEIIGDIKEVKKLMKDNF